MAEWHPLLTSYPESEKINACSLGAEAMFTRLIAKADDYGNFWSDPTLLLAYLFGHRIASGSVSVTDTARWRDELVTNALVTLYGERLQYLHVNNPRRRRRTDVKPDQRFPVCEGNDDEQGRSEYVTKAGRGRAENVPLDADTDADTDANIPLVGKPTAPKKGASKSKRSEKSFLASDYSQVTEAYKLLKGIEPHGDEWKPIQQTIKSMFLDGRTVEQIIGCMKALSESPLEWAQNWTLKTVRMKLPEWIVGKLDLAGRGPSQRNGPSSSMLELQKARVDDEDMESFNRALEERKKRDRSDKEESRLCGKSNST